MGRNGSSESFDYENAELDILDAGGDPDYLNYNDREKRDEYLRKVGLNPKSYGSKVGEKPKKKSGWFDEPEDDPCFLTSACVHARGLPTIAKSSLCFAVTETVISETVWAVRMRYGSITKQLRASSQRSTACRRLKPYGIPCMRIRSSRA